MPTVPEVAIARLRTKTPFPPNKLMQKPKSSIDAVKLTLTACMGLANSLCTIPSRVDAVGARRTGIRSLIGTLSGVGTAETLVLRSWDAIQSLSRVLIGL